MNFRKPLAWAGRIVAALVALVVVAYGAVHLLSVQRAGAAVRVMPHFTANVDAADSALLAEGERVANVRGCVDCHGANLGGKMFIDVPAIATVYAPNITRGKGGRGADMSTEDWELAIRHGVRRDGTKLAVMPAQELNQLTDDDVAAIIAYARSVEPVESDPAPAPKFGPMGRALFVAGQLPIYGAALIDHPTTHRSAITPEVSIEFGRYVVNSCTGCHGPNFSGGRIPATPPEVPLAANLTPDSTTGIGRWTEEDFMRALREGVRPDGQQLAAFMPVQLTKRLTDTEIKAAYLYLRALPPTPHGMR